MANPQIENGHTDIANELLEAMCRTHLSPYEWRVLLAIARLTWGWHKKEDTISMTQIAEITGIDRRHVQRSIRNLTPRQVLADTTTGVRRPLSLRINKNYEEWLTPLQVSRTDTNNGVTTDTNNGALQRKERNKQVHVCISHQDAEKLFSLWWSEYPSKKGKKPCAAKYRRLLRLHQSPETLHDEMITGLRNLKTHCRKWKDGFIPNPLTFLNQERWNDEPEQSPQTQSEALHPI